METGVAIEIIQNQALVFISNMASTVVLSHGKWKSNKQSRFKAVKQTIKV